MAGVDEARGPDAQVYGGPRHGEPPAVEDPRAEASPAELAAEARALASRKRREQRCGGVGIGIGGIDIAVPGPRESGCLLGSGSA